MEAMVKWHALTIGVFFYNSPQHSSTSSICHEGQLASTETKKKEISAIDCEF